jgi:fructooligosaccharide transport system substrate-binding protein
MFKDLKKIKKELKMKKIIGLALFMVFIIGLSACGGDEPIEPSVNTASIIGANNVSVNAGATFDPMQGVSAMDSETGVITSSVQVSGTVNLNVPGTYTLTYRVTGSDGVEVTVVRTVTVLTEGGCAQFEEKVNGVCVAIPKQDIVIMHGAPNEIDPFDVNFSGTEQNAKQQRQREVEQQFNVRIIYRAYPANAPWGPDRVNAIINASIAGSPLADVYWTTSDWLQQLANSEAIASIDKYMATHGKNIHPSVQNIGLYKEALYGFGPGNITVDTGLYFNADLIKTLGVQNPTDMFLAGNWNWTTFEAWAVSVKTAMNALGDDMFPLGGMLSSYAESMVALNGGSLINRTTGRVAFSQNPALETYTFLSSLYTQGLFELQPAYDSGSPLWMAGKVAIHPGNLWFVTADNRWGQIPFELGFVPYPKSPTFTGEYVSPVSGIAIYNLASGMDAKREELVFQVWNALQIWKTEQQLRDDFEFALISRFDEEKYVEAYMSIYDKVYLELINAIGIGAYSTNGWRANINAAIRENDSRSKMDAIKPIYDVALLDYLN